MSAQPQSDAALSLANSAKDVARIKAKRVASQNTDAKREELEQLFSDIKERRREALEAVKKQGRVITTDKSNSRGAVYRVIIKNPELTIAESCERQLLSIARQLSNIKVVEEVKEPPKDSFSDFVPPPVQEVTN